MKFSAVAASCLVGTALALPNPKDGSITERTFAGAGPAAAPAPAALAAPAAPVAPIAPGIAFPPAFPAPIPLSPGGLGGAQVTTQLQTISGPAAALIAQFPGANPLTLLPLANLVLNAVAQGAIIREMSHFNPRRGLPASSY